MGLLGNSGLSAQDAPKDPYGFGDKHWPLQVIGYTEPKITESGDKLGCQLIWKNIHPDYAKQEKLGNGNWIQLPVPEEMRELVPFDPDSQEAKNILFQLTTIFAALGFGADEMDNVDLPDLVGKQCLGKIFVKQNDAGFWQFNIPVTQLKPIPEEGLEGMNEFTPSGQSNGNGSGMDAIQAALAAETSAAE